MPPSNELREAIKHWHGAEDVKVVPDSPTGGEQVYAYGMLPDTTILGWFPLGNLDELEKKLRETGELT